MHSLSMINHTLVWGERTYVMGILNLTPDSFSGDGLLRSARLSPLPTAEAEGVKQARQFLNAGVDILDIGGESTRPGSQPVEAEEELRRVIPTIQAIAAEFPEAL